MKILTSVLLIVLFTFPAHADFYFFGVNLNTLKESNYKMVILGAATSVAVHTLGHYTYCWANNISVRQHGFNEIIDYNNPARHKREFAQAGFIAQHLTGLILTSIPYTRHSNFTKGYIGMAFVETVTYPLLHRKKGDLEFSHQNGGNRDLEYIGYMLIASHNMLRINWSE